MWESKDNCIDVHYNTDQLWFDGINGQHIQKPADIRKWEESKCHKLIEKHFPRIKADKMLTDLSAIALEWAKTYVRQRQTFKHNTKGENVAPLAFQHDPDGTYHELAIQLRNVGPSLLAPPREEPIFEPMDGEGEEKKDSPDSRSSLRTPAAPPRTSARSTARSRQPSPERETKDIFLQYISTYKQVKNKSSPARVKQVYT
jgi:hypothetical protein